MLRTALPACNDVVKVLVENLLHEDQQLSQNRRSAHRTPFVRPVLIYLPDGDSLQACSKNISPDGVGLLTEVPLAEGLHAKLRIHGVLGEGPLLLAELRWCDPFGDQWYLSGWKLLNEARSL